MSTDNFYRAFEDKYRGSRELIKSRLQVYLPFIKKIQEIESEPKAIDLGCGRGEWLELLSESGCRVQGVDLDAGMLESCRKRGFDVAQKDAIAALKELEDNSCWIISGFHLVEHLPFDVLQALIQDALRVLKPGGLLIMETPNPENIKVATANFYLDPTHTRPIPSELLSFLTEHYGFGRTKVLRLQEPQHLHADESITLLSVISEVSPDYAIIAQKHVDRENLLNFDELFIQEYGVSLDTLAAKFEERLIKLKLIEDRLAKIEAISAEWESFKQKIEDSIIWKIYRTLKPKSKKIK
ncbi:MULTISPECIES: class I SAM-dependent methyltransferase [unclassified Sulfuricurvum]|uniref:class I SAM-dependent methyltransferase n=1 Tax=unclassified Sulfuricurvum TaxID=2632390 RepID=UPI000A55E73E|nr:MULTISPECIES: class I SAM-dependent methyltransferase [unclassified Sulfuricurvum]